MTTFEDHVDFDKNDRVSFDKDDASRAVPRSTHVKNAALVGLLVLYGAAFSLLFHAALTTVSEGNDPGAVMFVGA
jgi:hypothetical protein